MDILALITAFGFGSLITAVMQWYMSTRFSVEKRRYDERKEAYIGLLESWILQEKQGFSRGSELDVGHWILRSQLVASEKVYALLKAWEELDPGSPERIKTTTELKAAMRDDLRSIS